MNSKAMSIETEQSSWGYRSGSKHGLRELVGLAIFTVVFAGMSIGQQPAAQAPPQPSVQTAANPEPAPPADEPKPLKPQTPQQKQLAEDTAKLLQLANELKAEMDKSTKDTLSLSVIKKADEVEKLARKVRDEMKATIGN